MAQAKNWCYTLHNEVDIEYDEGEMRYKVSQYEKAPATGKEHFQGYIQFHKRKRLSQLKKLNGEAHWELAKGNPKQNRAYCSKTESRLREPVEYGTILSPGERSDINRARDRIREGASDLDMLDEYPDIVAKYPRFIQHARRVFMESTVQHKDYVDRYIWQKKLREILEGEPHPREVIWRWDTRGNTGKSTFALNTNGTYYVTCGKHADIRYAYAYQRIVIFDWPRSALDRFPYDLVEQFKNGSFFCEKYESRVVKFNVPHVVVFANQQPDLSMLSADRWNVAEIKVL